MAKAIKSTDARKPAIVAALKAASGCTKITNVVEIGPNTYQGSCLKRVGDRWSMGERVTVEVADVTVVAYHSPDCDKIRVHALANCTCNH